MAKAVFLDRDGTINIDKDYLYKIEDFEFLPGAIEGLRGFKRAGYLLVVVTNQSGIGRGYYTEADYKELEDWFLAKMESLGAGIDAIYHCPHLPDASVVQYRMQCQCRKPALGMFEKAIKDLRIDIDGSVAVGDKMRDLQICMKYDTMKGYLVYSKDEDKLRNIERLNGGLDEVAARLLGF